MKPHGDGASHQPVPSPVQVAVGSCQRDTAIERRRRRDRNVQEAGEQVGCVLRTRKGRVKRALWLHLLACRLFLTENWKPKTEMGKKVQAGEIKNINEILDNGLTILEPEIIDSLIQLESELLLIGQAKGKFGGGQRRVFRQTQKKEKKSQEIMLEVTQKN